MNNNFNLLKNKKVLVPAIIFSVISLVMIAIAVWSTISKNMKEPISRESYIDQISGEEIYDPRLTTGGPPSNPYEPPLIGAPQLIEEHFTLDQILSIRRAVALYYKESKNEEVKMTSYYKDSLQSNMDNTYYIRKIKLAINNDQSKNIFVKLVVKGIEKHEVVLYEDENFNKEVKHYNAVQTSL